MFTEAFEALLQRHCTPGEVRAIETGGCHQALWQTLLDSGFLDLMAAEDVGGAELDLAEAFPILSLLGYYNVPLPVAQAIALRTLLPPGHSAPEGLVTFAPAAVLQSDGSLFAPRVPFGMLADHVLTEWDGALWLLDTHAAQRQGCGNSSDALGDLIWNTAVGPSQSQRIALPERAGALEAWGAALHAALLTGALTRSFEMALQYASERSQFGRTIGKFQAVQHQLAIMAEHVAAARMAAANAFAAGQRLPALLPAAVAKARCSEAAPLVASIAHALHGAIGITEEFDLQLSTRRLHAWRAAHGSENYWHAMVGQALLAGAPQPVCDFVQQFE